MDIPRKLSIAIFCGVPAIWGGGVVYELFGGSLPAMYAYEALLLLFVGSFLSKR